MANEKNLRPPWKKGQSGNPSGRPKESKKRFLGLITKEARQLARERGTTLERHIAEQMMKDNTVLMKYLGATIPQLKAIEVSGELTGPVAQIVIDLGTNGGEKPKPLTGGAVVNEPFKLLNDETDFPEPS